MLECSWEVKEAGRRASSRDDIEKMRKSEKEREYALENREQGLIFRIFCSNKKALKMALAFLLQKVISSLVLECARWREAWSPYPNTIIHIGMKGED